MFLNGFAVVFNTYLYRFVYSYSSENMSSDANLSGLYAYHVQTNCWKLLRDDAPPENAGHELESYYRWKGIMSRAGHSMLFHSKQRLLYIFGGERRKEVLRDMFTYNVDKDEIKFIYDGERRRLPATGFTQKATLDPDSDEIYLLSVSTVIVTWKEISFRFLLDKLAYAFLCLHQFVF